MWWFILVGCMGTPTKPEAPPPTASPATDASRATPPALTTPAVTTSPVPAPAASARLQDEQNSIDVFKAAAPATVFVTQNQLTFDRYRMRALEVPAGTGSGFLWDNAGHVVTNYHVVDGARSLTVTLFDGTELAATLVGGDPRKDVAVLQLTNPPSGVVAIARHPGAEPLEVGQKTVAIGNPFGLDHTLTVGVISALGREVVGYGNLTIPGMIQTDASINPGNSGGPLLDAQGRLIGMNTMIFSQSGSSAGIGFAVPSTTIERTVDQILTLGRVRQIGLGVSLVDPNLTRRQGIEGLAVLEVAPDAPAARAGLQGLTQVRRGARLGDVIVAIDGKAVKTYDDLYQSLDPHEPGDVVQVGLKRADGSEVTVPIEVIDLSGR
jgi:S1-C subfamily serine protease